MAAIGEIMRITYFIRAHFSRFGQQLRQQQGGGIPYNPFNYGYIFPYRISFSRQQFSLTTAVRIRIVYDGIYAEATSRVQVYRIIRPFVSLSRFTKATRILSFQPVNYWCTNVIYWILVTFDWPRNMEGVLPIWGDITDRSHVLLNTHMYIMLNIFTEETIVPTVVSTSIN